MTTVLARSCQLGDGRFDVFHAQRVEVGRGLVEQDQVGVEKQDPRQLQALFLAARQQARILRFPAGQAGPLQDLADGAGREAHAAQPGPEAQVGLDAGGQQQRRLEDETAAPAQPRALVAPHGAQLPPVKKDLAAIGPVQQPQQPQQGRFAGAVGTKDDVDRPG